MKTITLLIIIVMAVFGVNAQDKSLSASQIEKANSSAGLPPLAGNVLRTATAFYTEDFAGGIPADWTIIDSIVPSNNEIWLWSDVVGPMTVTAGMDSFATNGTTASNGYIIYNSDAYGNNATDENTSIMSPPINCTGQATVHLGFNQYYRDFTTSTAMIYVSTDAVNWSNIVTYDANTTNPQATDFDISSIAANQDSVYLLFQYIGSWGWYWMIDDIQLNDALTIGINTNSNQENSPLYPNPSTGMVTYTPITEGKQTITIYNTSGQLVYEMVYENALAKNLDLSKLSKGHYTVKVITAEKSYVQQLVLTE